MKKLTDLPQEVLVEILLYCSGADVLNVGQCFQSQAVWSVVGNKKLWRRAVIGPGDMKTYLKYLGAHTTSLTMKGSTNKVVKAGSKTSTLTESLVSSIRLRCPHLTHLELHTLIVDTQTIRFSLFPRTLESLVLNNVSLANLAAMRQAVRSSPFYCIKKSLSKLKRLELIKPFYLQSYDSLAIVAGCETTPTLTISGDDHLYTFTDTKEDDDVRMTREGRKDTKKLFMDLIEYHFTKKSYNTRRVQPS